MVANKNTVLFIFAVCVSLQIDKMQNRLDQQTFTVSHSPVDRYPFAIASPSPLSSQDRDPRSKQGGLSTGTTTGALPGATKTVKDVTIPARRHSERMTSLTVGFQQPSISKAAVECLYFLDNEGDILIQLENDIINVKILLSSPHLGSLRTRVESTMKTLMQLKELVGLLSHCQEKVRCSAAFNWLVIEPLTIKDIPEMRAYFLIGTNVWLKLHCELVLKAKWFCLLHEDY